MKTKKEIEERLAQLLADHRIHYSPATIQINGPLALIQCDLAARIRTLEWILERKTTPLLKGHCL